MRSSARRSSAHQHPQRDTFLQRRHRPHHPPTALVSQTAPPPPTLILGKIGDNGPESDDDDDDDDDIAPRHVDAAPPPPSRDYLVITRVAKLVAGRCMAEIELNGEDDAEHLRITREELGDVEELAKTCCAGIFLPKEFPEPFFANFPWRLSRRYGYGWLLDTDGQMYPRGCKVWARPGEETCDFCESFSRSDALLAAIERAHDRNTTQARPDTLAINNLRFQKTS
jgi:hypothetical protein